jgi:hypothetical protein
MKYIYTLSFVLLSLVTQAQKDSTKSEIYLTRVTLDVGNVQDPLLFASLVDISLNPNRSNEKYATHSLLGSLEVGEVRTVQMDLLNKKIAKSAITSTLINFSFKTRSVDDFIGVFNFIFEFSDGSNYPYRLGAISVGNDLKLNSVSRTIYIR